LTYGSDGVLLAFMTALSLSREQAYELVLDKIGRNNLLKHILAVEAGLRRLAGHLGEDVEYWGLTGLLHDLDYNETKEDEPRHTYITRDWLAEYNLPEEMLYAIHAHPGHVPCKSRLDYALFAVDPATGFIVACALMHPDRKLAAVDEAFMLRRFKEKRFAAGASRENIAACSHLDLELGTFLVLVREGMLTISDQLGL
jgi:putative nucleotidyltransferase with HDIG domain